MHPHRSLALALVSSCGLWACSSTPVGDDQMEGASAPSVTGLADGKLSSVALTELYRPELKVPVSATALAFNESVPGELWVTLRQFPSGEPCTETDDSGCAALPGVVAILADATGDEPRVEVKEDGNSWHFMRRPIGIAWGDGELFATCGEARTDNYENDDVPYAGPVLWSSDPSVFGARPLPNQNGTHLDMLHETPYCMGIAHEAANAFWVVNGDAGSLDRYDFHAPHQIGGEDHGDGEVFRYVSGELARLPEVPSHLAYDAERKLLYVADTGNARLLRVDPSTATRGGAITTYEPLQDSGEMVGAQVVELVSPGLLEAPSGVWLADDVLYVTDNANSHIYAFDPDGKLLVSFDTGLPQGALGGVTLGPDQKVYFTDLLTGAVLRIDPQ